MMSVAEATSAVNRKVASLRSVQRLARNGRKVLASAGGLPWAAFENGTLPDRWWCHDAFAAALVTWQGHARQLAYRARWEDPPSSMSMAERAVYLLVAAERDGSTLRSETAAIARAVLGDDASRSDAPDVNQWVARLERVATPGCDSHPGELIARFPMLQQEWDRARGADRPR
jgi:hypothetical protein